jgi:flagellar protein FlaJ
VTGTVTEGTLERAGITVPTYALSALAAVIVFGVAVPYLLVSLAGLHGLQLASSVALSLIVMMTVLAYPMVKVRQVRSTAQDRLPLFVTQMAALSTSDMPIRDLFGTMSRLKGFGVLSEDAGLIERMIGRYNIPISEACRIVAANAVAPLEAEFLKGFAHAVEVGQKPSVFLAAEQRAMMERFSIRSEAALSEVSFLKELFVAVSTALIFMMVFIIFIPILTSSAMGEVIVVGMTIFVVTEVILLLVLRSKLPRDQIWAHSQAHDIMKMEPTELRSLLVLVASVAVAVALLLVTFSVMGLEIQISVAVSCLPLLVPGLMMAKQEKLILARDESFGPFVRALGRSQEVSEQTMPQSMRQLAGQNYDELSPMVESFARRVNYDNDAEEAWRLFSEEANSDLVQQFTGVYHESVKSGASPGQTSTFIDDNHTRVLALRRKKLIMRSNFLGVAYGILFALAVTMWVTVAIVEEMGGMLASDNTGFGYGDRIMSYIQATSADLSLMMGMCVAMIVVHAAVSAAMLAFLKGGRITGCTMHFAALTGIGMITWYPVNAILAMLLG